MSRHKLVKALDLDEELDDFDGGIESDNDDEVNAEDREQLRLGTIEVRSIIGNQISITDKDIEDSLWHYYYDIAKTVNYLLRQTTDSQSKKVKRESKDKDGNAISRVFHLSQEQRCRMLGRQSRMGDSYPGTSSMADFFLDSPWLNVPAERLGEILIEPLHPRGGLLGGTSKQDGAPRSKLAALAAARKNKENRRMDDGHAATSSVTLLDKLGKASRESKTVKESEPSIRTTQNGVTEHLERRSSKKYPVRRSQAAAVSPEKPPSVAPSSIVKPQVSASPERAPEVTPAAPPSAFAQTILGSKRGDTGFCFQDLAHHAVRGLQDLTEFNFTGPSPDDVVLKAQSSKSATQKSDKRKSQPLPQNIPIDEISRGVRDVALEEQEVKRKNIDVLAEFKKNKPKNAANLVVIGHVDAGKSTLMGRLLHDLNVVDKRTIEKYRKEADRLGKSSFALAFVLDQGTEERERGVTIDVATNNFETEGTRFTILDAPGHRDFIPNMIAGASQADFAVLVIDAGTGNFESGLKGQTKEHALLVRSMGVQRIVVAVNKLDAVEWSKDRFDEISQQVSAFLTSAGFLSKNLAFVPCAGLTGDNIVRKSDDAKASWYAGPTLISVLESSEPIARALEKPLRLTIDDIFRSGIQNPLSVSGRVDGGNVQVGDVVLVLPANQRATVKGIEVDSEPSDWAVAGQNVVLHLTDIETKYLKAGDVICPPSAPVQCVTSLGVKMLAFEHITPMHCEIHRGRLYAPAKIAKLVAQLDKASGAVLKGKKLRLIRPGTVARVVIEVESSIPLEPGGRVIVRAGGETIGAGLVE